MRLVPFRKNYGPVTSAGVVPGKFCSDEQALGTGSLQVVEKFCGKCTKIKYNVVVFIEATENTQPLTKVHRLCKVPTLLRQSWSDTKI